MKYALVYEFDKDSQEYIDGIIQEVTKVTGNNYMAVEKISGHLTIGCFETESESLLIDLVESGLKDIRSSSITLGSVGIFKPSVLFIAPILNQFLQESCECFFDYLHEIASPSDDNHYAPHCWVPHIAINITDENLTRGLEKCLELFEQRSVICEKLTVVKCDPYTEIKQYSLKKCC